VLGASLNPERYSFKALQKLTENKILTRAFGLKNGVVFGVTIDSEKKSYKEIDTVTLYLNPKRQKEYYEYIVSLKPKRVIFNPGTENVEFVKLLKSHHINSEEACTLVLLATNQY